MENEAVKNSDRFLGFAETYEEARPEMPLYVIEIINRYLSKKPETVIDLGCGTGLSTAIWKNNCKNVIGIEPNDDMLKIALNKKSDNISFIKAFSHDTKLPDNIADVVICSQSFHWMEPFETLNEVNRILNQGGIFATVDCDWPPVCKLEAEIEYNKLFHHINQITEKYPELKNSFKRWDKDCHLDNINKSNYFKYFREIVFINSEKCNSERFINLALSQGGLQAILKTRPEIISPYINDFKEKINEIFKSENLKIDFCYRMRIGCK